MAAIRHQIQKEVFSPNEERLLAVVNVTKAGGRKKKSSFITLSVSQVEPKYYQISRVKVSDKKESGRESSFKRVKTWQLSELKMVDGHTVDTEGPAFDLHFDKQSFKWVASSVAEKKSFIAALYKVVYKSAERKKPDFLHVDEERLKEALQSIDPKARTPGAEEEEEVLEQEEYQELSPQEEADLENLLLRDNAIQDAAAFMENLSEELSQLDQGNIHQLMGSEEQIQELMEHLDQTVSEIEKMEMRLNVYDELLSGIRDTMYKLGGKYSEILLQNTNLKALSSEVSELVSKLDIDSRVESILNDTPLTGASNLRDCEAAAETLQHATDQLQELGLGLSHLQAVTDQKKLFDELSSTFARRLHEHLSSMFVQHSTLMLENASVKHTSSPAISSHSQVHTELLNFSKLTKWLKDCETIRFGDVMDAYIRSFRRVYEEEIRVLMNESRVCLGIDPRRPGGLKAKVGSNVDLMRSPLSSSLMMLSPSRGREQISQSVADFSHSPGFSGAQEQANLPKFEQVFSMVLEQLQPVCVSEQKFLVSFFHFQKSKPTPEPEDDHQDGDDFDDDSEGVRSGEDETDGSFKIHKRKSSSLVPSPELQSPGQGQEGGEVDSVLIQLFTSLLPEIEGLIQFGERKDGYNTLYLLVSVSQRLMFAAESGARVSYLDETLKKALLYIRRAFDKFITSKRREIEDMKVSRSGKCGILPCVTTFKTFAERAESIVMGTDRRTELDKAYLLLIEALFKTVERAAREHTRTPPDVIKFENYNKIVDILSRLKISCLESSRDEAKRKKVSHKKVYVSTCLGKPLDKLSTFFEGVESLIAGGTKAEEVGYRLDYSRNELKKCIKEYPGKEVKRGLEKLYRRVEKDVSEEVLQVMWGGMQEAFIQQCKKFEALIAECYPGSGITLEFTIADLAEYFINISAQK